METLCYVPCSMAHASLADGDESTTALYLLVVLAYL